MTQAQTRHADTGGLFDRLPVAIFRSTPEGNIIAANRALVSLLRYPSLDALLEVDLYDLYVDPALRDDMLGRVRAGIEVDAEEFEFRRADGTVIWVRAWSQPVREGDDVAYLEGTLEDVTDRRLMQTALERSEELFRSSFDHAPVGLAIATPAGRMIRVNDAFCELLEAERDALIGMTADDLVHPDDRPALHDTLRRVRDGETDTYVAERRLTRLDGTEVRTRVHGSAMRNAAGELVGISVQLVDLTPRDQAQAQLAQSEALFRSAFENAPVGMAMLDAAGRRLRANPAACRVLGMTEDEYLTTPIESFLSPADAADARQKISAMQDGTLDTYRAERRLRAKGGEFRWVQFHVSAVRDHDGNLQSILSLGEDTTARKRAMQALERSEQENRALVAANPDMMFTLDRAGRFLSFKPAAGITPTRDPDEFLGRTLGEVFPDRVEQVMPAIERALESGEQQHLEFSISRDGTEQLFDGILTPFGIDAVLMVIREVTDRVMAQRQLEELIRSKDELVASVSHELRTPLTTVVGMARELHDRYDSFDEQERRELLHLIVSQGTEMAELIDDLLVAAREDVGMVNIEVSDVDLADEIAGVLSRWSGIEPEFEPLGDSVTVAADAFRFRQILRNLLANAERYGREPVRVRISRHGSVGRVAVQDSGEGLPVERWESIFEPYVRAHERPGVPASVGLGLTVSRQLARLMSGDITYRVDDGASTFLLELPLAGHETDVVP